MDALDARIAELGQPLDKAREILAEPEIRQGLANPTQGLLAGAMVVRLLGFSCALQSSLSPAARPAWIKPEPQPEPMAHHEPEPGLH